MLDLHAHTTYSDGTLTPPALVTAAVKAGVRALAITDHDTLAGWPEALATAASLGLELVPGVEVSTVYQGRSLHILGFYPDPQQLVAPLYKRLEGRKRRAQAMVDILEKMGYPIQLPCLGVGIAPGRPHIATALVEAGHVQSVREAFDRFLGDHRPAYVHYDQFSTEDGIQLLRSCGAVPIWAHPALSVGGDMEEILPSLVAAGLMGMEVYHPNQTASEGQRTEALCHRYSLLKTGGSDYHGPAPQANTLNMLNLPLQLLDPIKQRAPFAAELLTPEQMTTLLTVK